MTRTTFPDACSIVVVQFGDFAQAFRRLQSGGDEDHRFQRYSVNAIANLTKETRATVTVVAVSGRPHEETLAPGLISIGMSRATAAEKLPVAALLRRLAPDRLIVRTPKAAFLGWASASGVPTLPLFADFITRPRLRGRRSFLRLKRSIRGLQAPCFCNHGESASQSIRHLGVSDEQIVPWDWPTITIDSEGTKTVTADSKARFRLLFVGQIVEEKGVGDCIDAVGILRSTGRDVVLRIVGGGEIEAFQRRIHDAGLSESIVLSGPVPVEEVPVAMRESDAVLVPSRRSYPEGFPKVIGEALACGRPLIASRHPAYVERLTDGETAMLFDDGQSQDLADVVAQLMDDDQLRHRLAESGPRTAQSLSRGIEWAEVVRRFVTDPEGKAGWVASHALPSYAQQA